MAEIFINILSIILGFTIGYCTRAVVYELRKNKVEEQIINTIKLGTDKTESDTTKEISYERYSDTEIVHCGSCAKLGTMACPYDLDEKSIACSLYYPE